MHIKNTTVPVLNACSVIIHFVKSLNLSKNLKIGAWNAKITIVFLPMNLNNFKGGSHIDNTIHDTPNPITAHRNKMKLPYSFEAILILTFE